MMSSMIKGKENIDIFRLKVLRSALYLETQGIKRRGRSVYSIVKEEYNLKGSKQKVLDQLDEIIYKKGQI